VGTRIIFITATDTGVGKTLLTSLLLCHLRDKGSRCLAIKPFCSGSRRDAELLHCLQDGELTLDEINPSYFPEPVAPLVSARKHHRLIRLDQVVEHINSIAARRSSLPAVTTNKPKTQNSKLKTQKILLIEGSGGLLVPLGERYTVRDLIARLACEVIVVSPNKLGTINHTLLTLQALRGISRLRVGPSELGPSAITRRLAPKVALMDGASSDPSTLSNANVLTELLDPIPLISVPFLGARACRVSVIPKLATSVKPVLARLLA
jgi:dethiobiotin synthase